jgi:hypothetical protein
MQRRDPAALSSGLLQDEQRQKETFDFDAPPPRSESSGFSVAQMRLSLPGGAPPESAQEDEDDDDGGERLRCQDDIAQLNRMFNTPSGGPTVAFVLGVAGVAIQIPHTAAGTFFSPGVGQCMDLFSEGGSLVLVWMSCFWVFFLGLIFAATQFRKVILPGAQLDQLGAGTLHITPKSYKSIATAHKFFYPTSPVAIFIMLSATTCMLPTLIFGIGLQSPAWNRASALLGMILIAAEIPLSFSWLLALRIAVVLSKDEVRRTTKDVRAGGEMSDADWKDKVTEPTKRLAGEVIPTVSKAFGATQGTVLFICILGTFALYTLSVSDMYWGMIEGAMSGAPCSDDPQRLKACEADAGCDAHSGDDCAARFPWTYKDDIMMVIHVVIGIMGVLLVYVPISVATGPADVSTECEIFVHELNNVRLLTLAPPIHARLSILETAISKMNRGQGMGFLLGMTVLNKAQLTAAARGLGSAIMLGSTYVLNLQSQAEVTADQCRSVRSSCLPAADSTPPVVCSYNSALQFACSRCSRRSGCVSRSGRLTSQLMRLPVFCLVCAACTRLRRLS